MLMDDPRLRPTLLETAVGLLVLTGCFLVLTWIAAGAFIEKDPFALIGVVIAGPFFYWIGRMQYRGTFQAQPKAAGEAGIAWYLLGAFGVFGYLSNVGEYYAEGGRAFGVVIDLWPLLAMTFAAILIGRLNRTRARRLRSIYESSPDLQPRRTTTLRELLIGVGLLSIAMAITAYGLRAQYPKDAEHVGRNDVPFSLPDNATDVSYHSGLRGTKAYEFTTDETAFRRWVEEGIGSIESNRSSANLEEIVGEHRIRRYRDFLPNQSDDDRQATIIDGLQYSWHQADRGVYAAFDRRTGRAYYYAHFH
jgi:hypothetical protein